MTTSLRTTGLVLGLLVLATVLAAGPPKTQSKSVTTGAKETPGSKQLADRKLNRRSVEVARDRAKLMHEIYAATLDVMHHRYFHGDRAMVPARAMEDVFSEIQRQSNVQARWISVSFRPMNIDHKPRSEFEKRAAKEIAGGKREIEDVDGDFYRRAGAIPLKGSCVNCHDGTFATGPTKPKFAGLIINVPLQTDSTNSR